MPEEATGPLADPRSAREIGHVPAPARAARATSGSNGRTTHLRVRRGGRGDDEGGAQMEETARAVSESGSAQLPISRLTLFTTGVGFFEHAGVVQGDGELELTVPVEHMDDLLQSLVVRDLGGGLVEAVRYASRDPLARVLKSYAFDLSAAPSLADLLRQARGEPVRVSLGPDDVVSGLVAGVEEENAYDGTPSRRAWLTVVGDAGLRRIDLVSVTGLAFQRPETRAELDAALSAIVRYRGAKGVPVWLRFRGEGERPVRVGYLRAMPVWKTSYRLALGDGEGDLQGWAIFDNPTDLDLDDVRVTFVAGRPGSFVSELFDPAWVERARVASADHRPVVPPRDRGALPDGPGRQQLSVHRMASPAMVASGPPGLAYDDDFETEARLESDAMFGDADVHVAAEGVAGVATFAYRVEEPVSVGRHESAMVPVVQAKVPAHAVSLYDGRADHEHPFRAVRVVNRTDAFLAAGPVAVFDGGGFTGMARIGDVPAGEERLLSFAVDVDVRVERATSADERFVSLRLAGGSIVHEVQSLRTARYRIVTRPGIRRFVVVDHEAAHGYELESPAAAPARTPGGYRFGILLGTDLVEGEADVDPGVPVHLRIADGDVGMLEVVESRVDARHVAVARLSVREAEGWLRQPGLASELRAGLEDFVRAGREVERLDETIAQAEAMLKTIESSQERVRQNMAVIEHTSPLYARYVRDLGNQEDLYAGASSRLSEQRDERQRLGKELERLRDELG